MKPPAFQFYADDFVSGVMDMTRQDRGDYIMLLCWQWSKGFIPSDRARLSRIVGGDVSEDVLAKFQWDETGGRNARMEKVRAEQDAYRAKQKANADLRWSKRPNQDQPPCGGNATAYAMAMPPHIPPHIPNGCQTDAMAMPTDMPNACSPSPSPTQKKEEEGMQGEPKRRKRPTTTTDAEWVESLKLDVAYRGVDIDVQLARCANWCAVNQKENSRRRFINWLNREKPLSTQPNGHNPKPTAWFHAQQQRAGMEAELREHEQQIWTTDPSQKPKIQARIDELRKALGHLEPQAALL
jgi:uncharacterized protein YdaU (DUF1376 family)